MHLNKSLVLLIGVGILTVHCAPRIYAQYYTATDLSDFGGSSMAVAINNSGTVMLNATTPPFTNGTTVFSYFDGTSTEVASDSLGMAINESGEIVGYTYNPHGVYHAFTEQGGIFTDLGGLGSVYSAALAVNDSGLIAGYVMSGTTFLAMTDEGGVVTNLGTLGGSYSAAYGVNNSGLVVGFSQRSNGTGDAFSDIGGVMSDLGSLGGLGGSVAFAVNNSGEIVGTSANGGGHIDAFDDIEGVMTDLGSFGGYTSALDVNNSGLVVGYSNTTGNVSEAFADNGSGMVDLNDVTSSVGTDLVALYQANGVNDEGQIVGYGINSSGNTVGFLLTPTSNAPKNTLPGIYIPPAPIPENSSSGILLFIGISGAVLVSRFRKKIIKLGSLPQ